MKSVYCYNLVAACNKMGNSNVECIAFGSNIVEGYIAVDNGIVGALSIELDIRAHVLLALVA
jgi:hypothetical protein